MVGGEKGQKRQNFHNKTNFVNYLLGKKAK